MVSIGTVKKAASVARDDNEHPDEEMFSGSCRMLGEERVLTLEIMMVRVYGI